MVQMKHTTDTYSRKPYSGLSRSLVIAIDVGTTFSGVSYAILEPGEVPKIHGVTRFPGQEHVAGNSKIPSVIYYDKYGNVMAAGADAEGGGIIGRAEDEGWIRAELFKLRLRPRTMQLNMNGMRLTPLPKRKTPVQVFGDYLKYLLQCTHSFITDTHANGTALWNTVQDDIQFVLSHPNGWEGPQQTRMRNAAVHGGLVPDTDAGRARIRFVTEGEASLHACVLSGLANDVLSNPSKNGFLIADAGGGTLDISAYAIKSTQPLVMEEIAPPDCLFAGSVFVSRRAREFFAEKLKHSKYGTPDAIDHITRKFDETTKRLFRDRNELQFVPFGSPLDKDPSVGVRNGQLKLTGNEVANLFEPSVDAAVNAIKAQIEASNGVIKSVFLVGGYAASPWLFTQLQERLDPLNVSRPDTQTSKAVADGAIGFYCDHHVSARMSKFMYGVEFLRELDPNDPDHVSREGKLCELPSGPKLLPDAFDCILSRSVKVKESTVFTRKYCTELTNLSMLSVFEVEIWCFRGGNVVPKWIDRHDDNFSTLCVVQANLSLLESSAEPKVGKNGKKYWTIVFSVEIHFGLTEFKARIKWMDNGMTKYGPAVIVYNERGHRVEDDDIDIYPEDDATAHSSRSDRRSERPHSRSQTPDAYYPPGGSTSRRSSNTAMPLMERSSSITMGYPPSITPSTRNANLSGHNNRGSDGDRPSSDSERKKDKGKDRYRAEASAPADRGRGSGIYAPSISKGLSGGSVNGEHLSAGWNAGGGAGVAPSYSHSRSPSVKEPPQPSSQSIYGGNGGGWDDSAPPRSAVSDQRQSHLWDNPPQSAALDAILERPKSPYPDRPKSPYVPGASQSKSQPHYLPPDFNDQPKSPFVPDQPPRTASPFVDGPKSAFGETHASAAHTPIFGDSGPAANAGGNGNSLFGNNPTSVFGEAPGGATDTWGIQETPAPPPPAETPPKSAKSKKKGSLAASPVGGLGKTSPALGGAGKSSLGKSPNPYLNNDDPAASSPIVAAPASPAAVGGGLWGSKAPSPFDKKDKHLSPLNPAAQMTPGAKTPGAKTPAKEQNAFEWDSNDHNATGGGGGSWGNPENNENTYQDHQPSPASKSRGSKTPAKEQNTFEWNSNDHTAAGAGAGGSSWGNFDNNENAYQEHQPSPASKSRGSKTPAKEHNAFDWDHNNNNAGGGASNVGGDSWGKFDNNENAYQEHQPSPASKSRGSKTPAKEHNAFDWDHNNNNAAGGAGNVGGDSWGNFNNNENAYNENAFQEHAAPVEEPSSAVSPVDEIKDTVVGKGKKKKKGAAAKSIAQDAFEKDEEERKKRDAEEEQRLKAEKEAADEADRKAEAIRIQKEQADQAERDRIAEEKAAKEKEELQKAKEEEDRVAAAASSSIFGNDTSGGVFSGETGGGDDGATWGSWANKPAGKKGKTGKAGKTPLASATASQPSAFGFGAVSAFGGGSSWGMTGSTFGSSFNGPGEADPSLNPEATEQPATVDTWNFNSGGPNLGLSFGDPKPPSRAPSPQPQDQATTTQQEEDKALDELLSPAGDGEAAPTAEAGDGAAEEDEGPAGGGKKKKKKKGKGGAEESTPTKDEATQEEPAGTPAAEVLETPTAEVAPEPFAPAAGGKKKKKKK